MDIRRLTTETADWDSFVRSTPGGSPFHLLAWKQAVEAAFSHRPHYLMAVRGGGLGGGLPPVAVRGGLAAAGGVGRSPPPWRGARAAGPRGPGVVPVRGQGGTLGGDRGGPPRARRIR